MTFLRAIAQARQEARRKARSERAALDSLPAFVRHVWSVVEPEPLRPNWHIDLVLRTLQRQIEGDPACRSVVINIPPGSAKSLMVSVLAPAWEWLHNPSRRKLFFSASEKVSIRDSMRMRNLIESDDYKALIRLARDVLGTPLWTLAKDLNQKGDFANTAKGFRQCWAIGANFTGQRADDYVIDDPVPVRDILGNPERVAERMQAVNEYISMTVSNRVNILSEARRTLIMQRLHPSDPAGAALSSGWHAVVLPMEFDPDSPHRHPDDPRTAVGQLLHPDLISAADVAVLKGPVLNGGFGWLYEAAYNQRAIQREGGMFKRVWFRRYASRPESLVSGMREIAISVDSAKKAEHDSDFHSIQTWGRRDPSRFLLGRRADRYEYPAFEQALDAAIACWHPIARQAGIPIYAYIEDTANGTTYMQSRGPHSRHPSPIPLIPFSPTRDTPGSDKSKPARAVYLQSSAEGGCVEIPEASIAPWAEDWLDCVCAFPRGANDDDVDGASQIIMRWNNETAVDPVDQFAWLNPSSGFAW